MVDDKLIMKKDFFFFLSLSVETFSSLSCFRIRACDDSDRKKKKKFNKSSYYKSSWHSSLFTSLQSSLQFNITLEPHEPSSLNNFLIYHNQKIACFRGRKNISYWKWKGKFPALSARNLIPDSYFVDGFSSLFLFSLNFFFNVLHQNP